MRYVFVPMCEAYAADIVTWKYGGELSIYDYDNEREWIWNRDAWGKELFAALDENGDLIGELSTQWLDPGEVALEEEMADKVLWIGFGMKPEMTGRGYGPGFVHACADYAVKRFDYRCKYVGLGVYAFNKRAVRAYEKAGFAVYCTNMREKKGRKLKSYWMRRPNA